MITFGPVPSRRLGKSLGINNIASPKVCSYACIYCQAGKTFRKTLERESFFKPETVYRSVGEHLSNLSENDRPDYLTFVSNGEPTLDINLEESVKLVRSFGIPVAVITNGSLLSDPQVREALSAADWVSVKTDAGNPLIWGKINKPTEEACFEEHLKGVFTFTTAYGGTLCTETMLIKGINDDRKTIEEIAGIIKRIHPFRAYISIPTRPASEPSVRPADPEELTCAWNIFTSSGISSELLTGFEGTDAGSSGNIYEDILSISAVHPLREDTLSAMLGKSGADFSIVESLLKQNLLRRTIYKGKKFYLREYHLNH